MLPLITPDITPNQPPRHYHSAEPVSNMRCLCSDIVARSWSCEQAFTLPQIVAGIKIAKLYQSTVIVKVQY